MRAVPQTVAVKSGAFVVVSGTLFVLVPGVMRKGSPPDGHRDNNVTRPRDVVAGRNLPGVDPCAQILEAVSRRVRRTQYNWQIFGLVGTGAVATPTGLSLPRAHAQCVDSGRSGLPLRVSSGFTPDSSSPSACTYRAGTVSDSADDSRARGSSYSRIVGPP